MFQTTPLSRSKTPAPLANVQLETRIHREAAECRLKGERGWGEQLGSFKDSSLRPGWNLQLLEGQWKRKVNDQPLTKHGLAVDQIAIFYFAF